MNSPIPSEVHATHTVVVAESPLFPAGFAEHVVGSYHHACDISSQQSQSPQSSILNLPAAGTGASATYDSSKLVNNTAVNTTVTVPSGTGLFGSLSTNQFIVLGVGDPMNATAIAAAGVGMTSQLSVTVAVPVAILPNLTEVYNTGGTTFSSGNVVTFEINHVHGDWWEFTYNSGSGAQPITGGSAWENGTYNLATPAASGKLCAEGATVGPSFIVAAFGLSGASTPTIPTTAVPWAVGVEPPGTSSTSYVPLAANAYPQFNTSLGTVGIQGHDQNAALGIDQLSVGNSVAYPGAYASLWGNYNIIILSKSTVTPVQASLAYNGSQIFNATAIDQNGANLPQATFTWQMSPASLGTLNTTTGTSVSLKAGSVTAVGKLWANVTYNCSTIHDVANISVTKTGGPAILSFVATPSSIVLPPQSTNTTVLKVVNGTWPRAITYTYTGLPAGCLSNNSTTLSCTPSTTAKVGAYNVTVFLNDSTGRTSNATTTVNIYADFTLTSFTISPDPLTVNTTMTVTTVTAGGVPPMSYTFTGLPPGCGTPNQPPVFTCSPNATGNYSISVLAMDAAGHVVTKSVNVTVNTKLTLSDTLYPANATIPYGGTLYVNVTASGGTPGYVYSFGHLPAGCTSSNTQHFTCTPTASGSLYLFANATDSTGANASLLVPFTVLAPALPTISSFVATPNPVNVSQATSLVVTAFGGQGTLSYAYTGLPQGCTSSNVATLSCTPSQAGRFTVSVTATDTASHQVSASLNLTVNSSASGPTISSFTITPPSGTLGALFDMNTVAQGGVAPLSYAYTGLPAGCASKNLASFTCTPSAAGNFTVTVTVTDSASPANSISTNAVMTVKPLGGVGSPTVWSFVADPPSVSVSSPTLFKVNATGGSGTLSYSYTGLPAGCSSSNTPSLPCTPTSAGNYTVWVYVNDTAGHSTKDSTLLTVTGGTTSSPSGSGLNLMLILVIVAVIAAVVAIVAIVLVRKKKRGGNAAPPPVSPYYPPQ
jgi:hypothetical protein